MKNMKKKWNTYILYVILAIIGVILTVIFNLLWVKILGAAISIVAIIINTVETKRHQEWGEYD